ncbi:MAG: hypothetical protein L6275_00315 [Candidatus Portnoybacteria bacterium]|nr:hypothetical protein [Candidatus Portnoybacteria bacterium]
MRHLFIIFTLLLAAVLQTTVVPFLSVGEVAPNLVLILALIFVILDGFKGVWLDVLLAGVFLDLFSVLPFGLANLSLIGAAYGVDWLNNMISLKFKFAVKIGLVVLGVFVFNLFLNLLLVLFKLEPIFSVGYLFWSALYNLLIALLIFNGIKKIFRKIQV